MASLLFGKPRPHLLTKQDTESDTAAVDRRERQRCRERSGGRCEVRTWVESPELGRKMLVRCRQRALHNHHLIAGLGRRNIGPSRLAESRLEVCQRCHREIHGHVLKPTNEVERYSAATVSYERVV